MTKTLVLTFIADDRPGLVDRISEAVAAEGGNWLESRMAQLAEKFAGIARVEVPLANLAALEAALKGLEAEGFHILVEAAADISDGAPVVGARLTIDLLGTDRPEIIHDITHCLAKRGISVEDLETDIRDAPMGGGRLFHACVKVRAPADLDDDDLRDDLEVLANELMVDISLGH